ncbi:C-type lectin domain family 1 member A-like [Platysternon megacephalum]|uniref:C-type lectin domain family 1 member A-like n=1 Tax=Platysternon megacephalum TaxID=55544 RepID=A0A4D9DXW0_9SAUR|nr:C-type lectin domain family 1 member A-like [Platysternon megacephalum]
MAEERDVQQDPLLPIFPGHTSKGQWNIGWAMETPFSLLSQWPFETTWLPGVGPMDAFKATAREHSSNTDRAGAPARGGYEGPTKRGVVTPAYTRVSHHVWWAPQHAPTHFCNCFALLTLTSLGRSPSPDGLTQQLSLAWQRSASPPEGEGMHPDPVP